jgi:alpha-beta hydrolase superfamily lysophospholipase
MMRLASRLLAIGLSALVAACVPLVIPPGVAAQPPAIEADRLFMPDGVPLPLRSWLPDAATPPRAVLLGVHGFNEYSNFLGELGPWLVREHAIAAYAYDQRGFGASPNRGVWPGEAALAADVSAAVAAIRARHPDVPLFILGESMGGAVTMVAMAQAKPLPVDGVILSAPAVWGRSSMPWYQNLALWVAAHTVPSGSLSGRGLGILASDNIEMLRARGRDPLVITQTRVDAVFGLVTLMDEAMRAAPALAGRVLILYGEHDQLIPPGAVDEMLARLPAAAAARQRFALYRDGYHMLPHDLQRRVVWRDIAAWIADAAAPLPSGADRYAAARRSCFADRSCPPAAADNAAAGETPG